MEEGQALPQSKAELETGWEMLSSGLRPQLGARSLKLHPRFLSFFLSKVVEIRSTVKLRGGYWAWGHPWGTHLLLPGAHHLFLAHGALLRPNHFFQNWNSMTRGEKAVGCLKSEMGHSG